jgi:hypothetical protein
MQSLPQTQPALGTLDGQGAGDCDQTYQAVISTGVLTLACVAAAIWRFNRDEL